MSRAGQAVRELRSQLLCLILLVGAAVTMPAHAAQPADLYGATVGISGSGQNALNAAFNAALERVLVKVTGRLDAGPALRRELFPDSRAILQQYRRLPDNKVYAAFDPGAIRRTLDRAGQPVWGDNRPLVAIWLAIDAGSGQRYLLSDGSQDSGGRLGSLRANLTATASGRGLPVVLPLLDARDLGAVSFGDVWGGFTDRVAGASRRYGSEALLIGRTSSMSASSRDVRWTLVYGGQQSSWQGNVSSGPSNAANLLAQQFATTATASGQVRLVVAGVNGIDAYARLRRYLLDLDMVKTAAVVQVQADKIEMDLDLRGDATRLQRILASSSLLSAAEPPAGSIVRSGDLNYRWAAGP